MQGVTKRCAMQMFLIECLSENSKSLRFKASSSGGSNSGAAKVHFNFIVPKVLG